MTDSPPPLSAEELEVFRDELAAVIQPERIFFRLLATIDAASARADAAETMYADLLPVAESQYKRADSLARENEASLVAWDSLVEHHETETAALNRRVGALTEAQRAAREWLTLALNGECGISNGHEGEESCTTAQIAEVLALLTVEPEAGEPVGGQL